MTQPPNLGNSHIKGRVVETHSKGLQFQSPLSRFSTERKLAVLEFTPLISSGKFGTPIRFPFFINPESIDFSHSHIFSQQQTRGGWVHTHWDDKPLTLKVRGNTGLYQYDFINILRYFAKVNGKTYLELQAFQNAKNTYRDKFLSEHLSREDALLVNEYIENTSIRRGSVQTAFISNDTLFQKAQTLGKIAFRDVKLAASVAVAQQATFDVQSSLDLKTEELKRSSQNQVAGTSTTLKGTVQKDIRTTYTNREIAGALNATRGIPSNRLSYGIPNTSTATRTNQELLFNNFFRSSFLSFRYPQAQTVFPNSSIIQIPAGDASVQLVSDITSDEALVKQLSRKERQYLAEIKSVFQEYKERHMRFDNPLQFAADGFTSVEDDLALYRRIQQNISAAASQLVTLADSQSEIEDLANELINLSKEFDFLITDVEELVNVIKRKIKIQSKKYETYNQIQEMKFLKKKINDLRNFFVNAFFKKKQELDQLLITPLVDERTQEQRLADAKIAQDMLRDPSTGAQGQPKSQNVHLFYEKLNRKYNFTARDSFNFSKKEQNDIKRTIQVLTTSKDPRVKEGAQIFVKSHNLITNGKADLATGQAGGDHSFSNYAFNQTREKYFNPSHLQSAPTGGDGETFEAMKNSENIFKASELQQKELESVFKGSVNKTIFVAGDPGLYPTLNDVIRLKLYYNGTIYEGFMTDFDWREVAETPNITFDFGFIVEREFLGASLSDVPMSLSADSGNLNKNGIDPTLNASTFNSLSTGISANRQIPHNQAPNNIGDTRSTTNLPAGVDKISPTVLKPGGPGNTVN